MAPNGRSDVIRADLDQLADHLRRSTAGRPRSVLGIVGPPGAGKSTVAARVASRLGVAAVVVGMDGFHLAQAELKRLRRGDRKAAPDTFDPSGYAALLRRLRANTEDVVYAPLFRRDLEEPIAGCVPVPRGVTCVITEGNYLLLDDAAWRPVRDLLDEVWYLDVPPDVRQQRLLR